MSTPPRTLRHPLAERTAPAVPPDVPAWHAISRGVSLFLGVWCLLEVWGDVRFPSAETNWIWIDLRPLPPTAARGGLSLLGILLIYFGIGKLLTPAIRGLGLGLAGALLGVALLNTVQWYGAVADGSIRSLVRVPLVLQTAAFLSVILAGLAAKPSEEAAPPTRKQWILTIVVFDLCVVLFPVTQIFCAGTIDDRGAADVLLIDGSIPPATEGDDPIREAVVELAGEYPEAAIGLIGPAQSTEVWQTVLEDKLTGRTILASVPPEAPADRKSHLRQLTAEHGWRNAIVCGEPVTLPRMRLDALRAGLFVTQVPLPNELPRKWLAIGREIPAVWMLRFGGSSSKPD